MDIQQYLTTHGLSQAEFARELGVTRSAVGQFMHKTSFPSGPTAARIVKISKGEITLEELFAPARPEGEAA